jgi:glycosyltransferase involved in cell wall biosynthesis
MDVSVIICTYNRATDLARTLSKFTELQSDNVTWELLVVDNNSKDDTRSICGSFEKKLPLRYIFEKQAGKSSALNAGIANSQADILIFTDDDVNVTPGWLKGFYDAAKAHPERSYFGGCVLPYWDCTPPKWYVENRSNLWGQPFIDYGPVECEKSYFVGANFAARKHVFQKAGLFRADACLVAEFGVKNARYWAEDYDMQERLAKCGFKGWYVPSALVYHRDSPHRMTESYVRWIYKERGRQTALTDEITTAPKLFGAPRYLWRDLVQSAAQYVLTRFTKPSKVWLRHECRMAEKWGAIYELRQHSRNGVNC